MSKYGVFSGPYFPVFGTPYLSVFSPNTGKYGPEVTPYLDIFYAVTLPELNKHWINEMSITITILRTLGLFIWKWAGPVKRAGLPRWGDFYPRFTWNLLSQFNQKVCYVTGKWLFDQVFFAIRWRKAIMQNQCSYII